MKSMMYRLEVLLLLISMDMSSTWNHSSCIVSNKNSMTCNSFPLTIPTAVTHVHIKDFLKVNEVFVIHSDLFLSNTWEKVNYLELSKGKKHSTIRIQNAAFRPITNLKVLKIETESYVDLDPDSLIGLDNLKILDLSRCVRLDVKFLTAALNGSEKVSNLEELYLSEFQLYWAGFKVDSQFYGSLLGKPLRILDLSGTHIILLDLFIFQALNGLEMVNMSRTTVDKYEDKLLNHSLPSDYKRLYVLDVSKSDLSVLPSVKDSILINVIGRLDWTEVFFYTPDILNISGITNHYSTSIYNTKVTWTKKQKLRTKQVIARDNNWKRLDIELDCSNCDFSDLQKFDIANNGVEYIHPSIVSCFSSIEHLDLSRNRLYIMFEENINMFGQLLNSSDKLASINLAYNNLTDLPADFFRNNLNLEIIILKGNLLTQFHLKLFHLQYLSLVDISNNDIKLLDSLSIARLDALNLDVQSENDGVTEGESGNFNPSRNLLIKLNGNPLLCDSCETSLSIRSLIKSSVIPLDELTCLGENGKLLEMSTAENEVEEICNRPKKIVTITVTPVVTIAIVLTIGFIIRKWRQRVRREKLRNNIIEMLRDDTEGFAVFLSYCSDDDDFVTENVIGPLNEGLQRIVGTERDLVCTGDGDIRLGRYAHDEFFNSIENVSVFVCVVSDEYNNCDNCVEKLNQAYQMKKPIVLMIKGDINIDLMSPTMKMLFRRNVRIEWEENDDNFVLKTTWDNVCNSVLDVAVR